MNINEIERLLEKYFNGETSIAEERLLKKWFGNETLPSHHLPLKTQFDFFSSEADQHELKEDFDNEILNAINLVETQRSRQRKRMLVYSLGGIAASLALAVVLFMQYRPVPIEDSFNDPAIAYQEIQKALFYVSDKLNMGLKPAQKAASEFNEGIEQASRISKLNEVQNYLMIE